MKTTVSILVLFFLSLKASAIFGLGDPDYCKKNPNDLLCSTGLNKVVEDSGLTDALSPFGDLLKTDEQKQLEAERIAKQKAEAERIARERAEAEAKRVAKEKAKAEAKRIADEKIKAEAKRVAKEKAEAEAERITKEKERNNAVKILISSNNSILEESLVSRFNKENNFFATSNTTSSSIQTSNYEFKIDAIRTKEEKIIFDISDTTNEQKQLSEGSIAYGGNIYKDNAIENITKYLFKISKKKITDEVGLCRFSKKSGIDPFALELCNFIAGKKVAVSFPGNYEKSCNFESEKSSSPNIYFSPITFTSISKNLLNTAIVFNPLNSQESINEAFIKEKTFPFKIKESENKFLLGLSNKISGAGPNGFNSTILLDKKQITEISEILNSKYPYITIKTKPPEVKKNRYLVDTRSKHLFNDIKEINNFYKNIKYAIGTKKSVWFYNGRKKETGSGLLAGIVGSRSAQTDIFLEENPVFFCSSDVVNDYLSSISKKKIFTLYSLNDRDKNLKKIEKELIAKQEERKKQYAKEKKEQAKRDREVTQSGGYKCQPYGYSTEGDTKYCLASCYKDGSKLSKYGLWKTVNKFQECGLWFKGHLPRGSVSGIGTWDSPTWR